MKICNALVGVDHGKPGAVGIALLNIVFDLVPSDFGQQFDFFDKISESVVGVDTEFLIRKMI